MHGNLRHRPVEFVGRGADPASSSGRICVSVERRTRRAHAASSSASQSSAVPPPSNESTSSPSASKRITCGW